MKAKLIRELQEYYFSLKDTHGHWRKEVIGCIYNARTSAENIETVKKILDIIMESDSISIETKVYISSKGISVRSVNEFINEARAMKLSKSGDILKPLSYNFTCNKLKQDDSDLEVYLGNNILRDIVYNRTKDEKATNNRLVRFQERYGESTNYRDNLSIVIQKTTPRVTDYANNEEFFEILKSIEMYLVQKRDIIAHAINSNKEFVDYFNYLLSKKAIDNDIVRVDRERLIRFLSNQDYTTGYEDGQGEHIESFTTDSSGVRHVNPDDIEVTDNNSLKLENYTAYDYDISDNLEDTEE